MTTDRATEYALELIDRIRSALDEMERVAREADGGHFYMSYVDPGVLEHIERHDPAAVLRLVDALRRIVDQIHIVRPFLTEPVHQNYAYVIDWNLRMLARGLGINTEEPR